VSDKLRGDEKKKNLKRALPLEERTQGARVETKRWFHTETIVGHANGVAEVFLFSLPSVFFGSFPPHLFKVKHFDAGIPPKKGRTVVLSIDSQVKVIFFFNELAIAFDATCFRLASAA
jgi:hypothetical protein